ncbi:MAG: protein translocase subunit SecD [Alicyclobacillaceae bacterium]|nr:protein translocase subunit SecD [Alicyclobacillaceae bacterium]
MKWGRFAGFLAIVLAILGVTAGTSAHLWKSVKLGLDLQGGFDLLYQVQPTKDNPLTPQGMQAVLQAVQLRVNSIGVTSPVVEKEDRDKVRVELAGTFDQQSAERLIGKTADLEIYGAAKQTKDGKWVPVGKPLIGGKDIKSGARWAVDPNNNENVVEVTFKDAKKWGDITTKYVGKTIYTFLDGQLINQATVQEPILNGNTEITGLGSAEACQELAKELNAGALPYPLKLVSSTNVGPSLGTASLRATMWAGLAAVVLIFAFMAALYRVAGLIADVALVAYAFLLLVAFVGLGVVLTLPGLAALVLGMGMAVDANIITYERVKDEMRSGKSLMSSIIAGNRRALRAIVDSNATTFIAGAVMYWFGQGDIRGFAVALMLSIVVSMLTAVLLSRAMLLLLARSNVIRKPWWYGIGRGVVAK